MPNYAGNISKQFSIRIDWREYFRQFVEHHGEPVKYDENFLLFPDGWRYSVLKYEGPEIAPPNSEKECADLQLTYWHKMRVRMHNELEEVRAELKSLHRLAESRDLPIQHRVVYLGGEGVPKLQVSDASPLDLTGLEAQKQDLAMRLVECNRQIGKYKKQMDS